MPAQVLVMCEACGRPQFAVQDTCVGCGAQLPRTPAPKEALRSAREKLLDGYEPFLEADLGRGKLLLLSEKTLEWRLGSSRRFLAELSNVAAVALRKRPVWETFVPAGLLSALALLPMPGWCRIALGAFAALWLTAGLVQRRCALVVRMKDGRGASLDLGLGGPAVQRADSIWATMGPELARLGVAIQP